MALTAPNPFRIGQTFTAWRDVPPGRTPCVYVLVDPRHPNRPRYLGSSVHPRERLKAHGKDWGGRDDVRLWRDALKAAGVLPAMRIVALFATERECRSAEWKIAERWTRRGVTWLGTHVPPEYDGTLSAAGRGAPGALAVVKAMQPRQQVAA